MKKLQIFLVACFVLNFLLIFITELFVFPVVMTFVSGILLFVVSALIYEQKIKEENLKKMDEFRFEKICQILFGKTSENCSAKQITIALEHFNLMKNEEKLEQNIVNPKLN